MAQDIIKGSEEPVFVRLTLKSGAPFDLTNTEEIRACFPKSDGTKLYKARILRVGAIIITSDIVTIDTTDLEEDFPISGTGIPADTTILKTPNSAVGPTAAGTIQISAPATASNPTIALTIGDITLIGNALLGNFQIPLNEDETDSLTSGPLDFEVKTVTLSVTKYAQFPGGLNMIDRFC